MTPDDESIGAAHVAASAGRTSRRQAMGMIGTTLSAGVTAPALAATPLREPTPPPVLAPRTDLVNVLEYETQARLVLGPSKVAPILGSDRTVTDRITLRPRMNVPTRDLDLTSALFGDDHFAPILVGPIAHQRRFHPDGEVATARGAAAAKAAMVVSCEADAPMARIAQAAAAPVWLQVYAHSTRAKEMLAEARTLNARAVIVTVKAAPRGSAAPAHIDWAAVDAIVKATSLPVIVKGVTHPDEARQAVARGAKGVVVSNYQGGDAAALPGTLLLVAPVVQAVGDKVPVLVDGSFRRGTDILKALGLGAKAVLIGRPVMWGLAAYGPDGVQGVLETLQTELARYMCMCGRPSLASLDPSVVRVHAPISAGDNIHG